MRLLRFTDAAQFHERVEAYLLRHETHHNLLFGILAGLREKANPNAYLALVEDTETGDIRAVALRTPPHNLVLSLADEGALALLAKEVSKGTLPGILGPAKEAAVFAQYWREETAQPYTLGMRQRIYRLEEVKPVSPTLDMQGSFRRAEPRDRLLLVDWLAAFGEEALGRSERGEVERIADAFLEGASLQGAPRGLYLWEDDEIVSMAGYSGPTPNGVRVSAVYTPPEHRGRGYARACTASLSQMLLEHHKFCFLFTDLANPVSNHIYQEIGYERVCDVNEYRFG